MAKDVERLVLELSADVSRLERGMRQGQRIAEQRTRAIEKSFDQMNQRTTRSVSDMGANIRNAIAGIAIGAAVREVQQYADAWTRMGNPLRAAGMDQAAVNARMEELVAISLRSRSSLEGTSTLYNRLSASSDALGLSQERVARITETVNKALATSSLTSSERSSAMVQLAQGLGSGTLAGDELKAIRENSQVLAQAIADEFGVAIGDLKKLGAEGELTSVRIARALENAAPAIDAAFARTTGTVGDAFTNLQTKVTQFVGQLDASSGASVKFAAVVEFVANNLDEIATAAGYVTVAVGTGLATAMTIAGVRTALATASNIAYQLSLIRMMAAQTGATAAQVALNGALAANPVGLVVVAVAALAAGIVILGDRMEGTAEATRDVKQANDALKSATDAYTAAADAASVATGKEAVAARQAAAQKRDLAVAARDAAQAKLAEAAATVALIEAEAGRRLQQEMGTPLRAMSEGSTTIISQEDRRTLADARAGTKEARDAIAAANAAITAATATLNRRAPSAPPSTADTSRSRASGPTPAELAATRAQIALEGQLAIARANSNEAEERRIQRLLDIRALTEQMTKAEVEGAEAAATAQVDAIIAGEATQKQIDELIAASERRTAARIAGEAAIEQVIQDQLALELELARINENPAEVLRLERILRLRQAINSTMSPEQKAAVAAGEARLNAAEDAAIYRERGAEMARTFVDIVQADDIGTEIGNRFRAAAFDQLESFLTNVFSQVFAGQGGGAGGGGLGGIIGNALGSLFGGNRALGGPVKAGMAYRVNENTPKSEIFVPDRDGWVGNVKQPRGQGRAVQNVNVRNELYLAGANGDAVIYGNVRAMLAASQRQTVAAIKAGAPAAQLENTLLRE